MSDISKLVKSFSDFKGLDLRSPTLLQDSSYATEALNVDVRESGSLNKRKGKQARLDTNGGFGLVNFNDINTSTGIITERLLSLDSLLKEITSNTLTITYSGANTAWGSTYVGSDGHFYFDLYDNYVCVLNADLNKGIDEGAPVTIADLVVLINAVADFAAVGSSSTTTPAALLNLAQYVSLPTGTGVTWDYRSHTSLNHCFATPFANYLAAQDNTDFENASFAQINGILYIASKYDYLQKYDGQNVYRAGLPSGVLPTSALGAATGITDATGISYRIHYSQVDNKGNIIEGIISEASVALTPANQDINVTVTNILAASGFNTNCGVVVGNQNAVTTITIDNGSGGANTLKIGDTAYFYDGASSSYVSRLITGRNATTISIAGAAVNVLDNAVISNNLKISIWRNTVGGETFYQVAEIPNNSFAATQVYNDSVATVTGNADYVFPVKDHGLPPIGSYLAVFQTSLCIAGQPTAVDQISYSDIDGPEYFPADDNAITVESARGDKITGIAAFNNSLIIFKQSSIHALTGEIGTDTFRVDLITSERGCDAYHTIKQIKGALFFANRYGVYALSPEFATGDVSSPISSLFTTPTSGRNWKKMVAHIWQDNDKYILFIPTEELSTHYVNNSSSPTYAFDYSRSAWLEWNNMDFSGGIADFNNTLFFTERRYSTTLASPIYYTYQTLMAGNEFDYHDHGEAITFTYKSSWENGGEPSIPKKFLRAKVYAVEGIRTIFESPGFTLNLRTERDFVDETITDLTLDFSGGGGGWGDFEWGLAPWGENGLFFAKSKLNTSKCQALRTVLENTTILENVLISGIEMEVVVPYKPGIKA